MTKLTSKTVIELPHVGVITTPLTPISCHILTRNKLYWRTASFCCLH